MDLAFGISRFTFFAEEIWSDDFPSDIRSSAFVRGQLVRDLAFEELFASTFPRGDSCRGMFDGAFIAIFSGVNSFHWELVLDHPQTL